MLLLIHQRRYFAAEYIVVGLYLNLGFHFSNMLLDILPLNRRKIMAQLQHTIKAFIRKGDNYYVAECKEIAVVTQGKTVDETMSNLQEAVALHLDGENVEEFGLAPSPTLIITMELEPSHA